MASQTLESMLVCTKPQEKKAAKPAAGGCADEQSPKCPRCDSANTKFCYYNNYSLSQPRYFCKSCRRYWTKGGTLRNVPVGGGCRKSHKRAPSSSRGGGRTTTYTPIPPLPSLTNLQPYYERPIMCNSNNNPGEFLENYALLGGGGFLQPPTNGLFHSLCYGSESSNGLEWNVENGGRGEMGNLYENRLSSGVKLEGLQWEFPLQVGNGEGNSGFGGYSLHGQINSTLMY